MGRRFDRHQVLRGGGSSSRGPRVACRTGSTSIAETVRDSGWRRAPGHVFPPATSPQQSPSPDSSAEVTLGGVWLSSRIKNASCCGTTHPAKPSRLVPVGSSVALGTFTGPPHRHLLLRGNCPTQPAPAAPGTHRSATLTPLGTSRTCSTCPCESGDVIGAMARPRTSSHPEELCLAVEAGTTFCQGAVPGAAPVTPAPKGARGAPAPRRTASAIFAELGGRARPALSPPQYWGAQGRFPAFPAGRFCEFPVPAWLSSLWGCLSVFIDSGGGWVCAPHGPGRAWAALALGLGWRCQAGSWGGCGGQWGAGHQEVVCRGVAGRRRQALGTQRLHHLPPVSLTG